jgi:hypothetical protein
MRFVGSDRRQPAAVGSMTAEGKARDMGLESTEILAGKGETRWPDQDTLWYYDAK